MAKETRPGRKDGLLSGTKGWQDDSLAHPTQIRKEADWLSAEFHLHLNHQGCFLRLVYDKSLRVRNGFKHTDVNAVKLNLIFIINPFEFFLFYTTQRLEP